MINLKKLTNTELENLKEQIDIEIQSRNTNSISHRLKLNIVGDKVRTNTHYNTEFVKKARNLQGRWENGEWVFPITLLNHVKNIMLECYGVTGENPYNTVKLLVKNINKSVYTSGIEYFGRPIVKAFGRDSGAKLQEDIVFISGDRKSGGSVKNWTTELIDATFEIHNFPESAINMTSVKEAISEGYCEIIK